MPGLGVVVNALAIVLGSCLGLSLGRFLPARLHRGVIQAQGLAVVAVGLAGAMPALAALSKAPGVLGRYALLIFVGSLIIGSLIGELFRLEERLERFGEVLRRRLQRQNASGESARHQIVEGFMTASLIYCVGAMTVLGSLQDGLGRPETLYVKALLDGTISVFLASSLGFGVLLSVIPVLVLQGALALASALLGAVIPPLAVSGIEAVGGVLIAGIGINLILDAKLRVGNMLPAVFVVLAAVWVLV
jgi:uncharacterized membrane protein YqgA involved in biofilm formation